MKAGMEHDDTTIHRCINADCGRAFARRVSFCPWCGTAQQPGAQPAPVAPAPPPVLAKPEPPRVTPPAPPAPAPAAPPVPPPLFKAAPAAPPQPPPPPPPPPPPRPSVPPVPPVPRVPVSTRKPIRLRWWLLALGALWLAWMLTKPSEARIERRMKAAIALAQECKPKNAQDELIALRKTRATPKQLRQLQDALNDAAAACTRAERRRSAWKEANSATEKLLRGGSLERAHSRLSTFTRRWGEDDATRELRRRIDAERHPLADPER